MRLSLVAVAEAIGADIEGPAVAEVSSYHSDSREVAPSGLFFALRGAETDGHRFLAGAVRPGSPRARARVPIGGRRDRQQRQDLDQGVRRRRPVAALPDDEDAR